MYLVLEMMETSKAIPQNYSEDENWFVNDCSDQNEFSKSVCDPIPCLILTINVNDPIPRKN